MQADGRWNRPFLALLSLNFGAAKHASNWLLVRFLIEFNPGKPNVEIVIFIVNIHIFSNDTVSSFSSTTCIDLYELWVRNLHDIKPEM